MIAIQDERKAVPNEEDLRKWIFIEEAEEHNLKKVTTKIPRDRFVVFTGLSGSGKSSLAIDTLFKEGQRRFVESLSSYARQFLGQMEKPKVKSIVGLSPAVSIEQKTGSHNPRSTVGTTVEINDYLRIMYASVGHPHCPKCGKLIKGMSAQEIVDKILENKVGTKFKVIAPIIIKEKGTFNKLFQELKKEGYNRLDVDGFEVLLDDEIPKLDKKYKHDISAVIDRLRIKPNIETRLTEAIETALRRTEGRVTIEYDRGSQSEKIMYHEFAGCLECGISIGKLNPRMFSFNSPLGACETCAGLGYVLEVDEELLLEDESLSINDGAIRLLGTDSNSWSKRRLSTVLQHYGFDLDIPLNQISKKAFKAIFHGSDKAIKFKFEGGSTDGRSWKYESERKTEGLLNVIRRRHRSTKSENARKYYEQFMSNRDCPTCRGNKLRAASLGVMINDKNIIDVTKLSIHEALDFFNDLDLTDREMFIIDQVLQEIQNRLQFLMDVGLEYLTLDRRSATLSGGEAQRIRLATQIGSKLVGVLYVLDEPSIGLHQRDNQRLRQTFRELRDIGNTVVVIEHDEETIRSADFILDIGPGAGIHGGKIVASGAPEKIIQSHDSITAKYLTGEWEIETPPIRRESNGKWIVVKGASQNNLQNITAKFPLGQLIVVSGVSGSGKSSLVSEVLWKALARKFNKATAKPGKYKRIEGLENLDKVIMIDQNPIGRTPRSNPATYTKVFDPIRDLFASLPSAKIRGFKKGRFSFNVKGGRCEACSGNGYNKIEMSFLGHVFVDCDVCKGKRFNKETLEIKYKGKNISQILQMTIEEAVDFFQNVPKIKKILDTLIAVGCGYLHLGQSAVTLSGGEAQRIKLSRELSKRVTGQTLILMDEPTTGLHQHDVKKLLEVLHQLVDNGNTILIIEHNLDVIKNADYIIDLGPEGGDNGGKIIATGPPEKIARSRRSYTGQFLRKIL